MKKIKEFLNRIKFKDNPIANIAWCIITVVYAAVAVFVLLIQFKIIKP